MGEDLNIIISENDFIWYCVYTEDTKDLHQLILIEPRTTMIDNSKRIDNLKRFEIKDKDTFLNFLYQNKINIDNIEVRDDLLDTNEKAYIKRKSILSMVLLKK